MNTSSTLLLVTAITASIIFLLTIITVIIIIFVKCIYRFTGLRIYAFIANQNGTTWEGPGVSLNCFAGSVANSSEDDWQPQGRFQAGDGLWSHHSQKVAVSIHGVSFVYSKPFTVWGVCESP